MAPDAGIFEHLGRYLTHRGQLYVDAWEPKLPLSYETTGVLVLLSGGDMYRFHLLNVVLMSGAVCAIVGLVVILVYDINGDDVVAPLAGLSMFLLPGFAVRPAYGFKIKYLIVFCGLLAIYLYSRGYPALSDVAAAAGVGYWQVGAIFPLIVVGLAVQRRDMREVERVVAGGLGFTSLCYCRCFSCGIRPRRWSSRFSSSRYRRRNTRRCSLGSWPVSSTSNGRHRSSCLVGLALLTPLDTVSLVMTALSDAPNGGFRSAQRGLRF